MKRFWSDVLVDERDAIRLDGKPVHTPGRRPLALPTRLLAEAVAEEWRGIADTIDPRAMPLTGLANAAIDRIAVDPHAFAAGLAKFGESDLLYYRSADPPELAGRQAAAWDPWLDWARTRYDVHFEPTQGVLHQPQPPATIARLEDAVAARDPFTLAGLSPIVTITGSLVLALAVAEAVVSAETAWQASLVDEAWQAERWGEDSLAVQARAARRHDYDAAVQFLGYLG